MTEADLNDSDFGESVDIDSVVTVQGLLRGCLLRTQLLELRAEYEKIAEELEPGQDVIWSKPNLLCRPRFEKKGKKGTQTNRNKHIPGNQNSSSDLPLGCNFDNVGNSGADKNSEVSGSYPGPCIKCNCTTSKSLEHVIDDSDKDVCDDKETHSELPAVDTNAQKLISKQDICVQTDDFTDTREHDEHPYLQNACKSADENVPPKTTRVNGETSSQKFQKTCDAAVQSDDGGFQHDHNGTSSISNKNTNVVNKHLSKVYTKSTAHFQSPEVSGNAISTEPEEPGDLGNKDDNNIRHSTPFKETQRNAEDVVLSDGDPKLNPILVSPVAPKRPCQDSDMAADDTSVWSENPTLIATDNTSLWGSDTITNDNPEGPLASKDALLSQDVAGLDKHKLEGMQSDLVMELLWIQQAIQSRKNYLRLKSQVQADH